MLLSNLNLLATAPGGVARLRELILTLAVQGKLVAQDAGDEPASELLKQIRAEKDRLIAGGKIKKDKPLAAIAKGDAPFELPMGWELQTLAEIGSWAIGSGFPLEAQGHEGLPILFAKVSDMNLPGNEFEILRTNHTIDDETVKRLRINVHQKGTVIFPKIGGAIATHKRRILIRPTAIDNNCLGITPSGAMSTSYLFLLLSSIDFTVYQAGTSVPALSQGTLGQIAVGLPPLAEQSRIVTRVEELMRLCDALEAKGRLEAAQHAQLVTTLLGTLTDSDTPEQLAENWQRLATHFDLLLDRPQAVDALEQTILQLAVRGLLVPQDPTDEPASALLKKIRAEKDRLIAAGQIKRDKPLPLIAEDEQPFALPTGWEWVRFPELCALSGGATPSKANPKYWEGSIPWVSPKDMKVPRISDAQDHISDLAVQGSLALIPTGSLLMVVRGMILAHSFPVAETLVPVTINQDMKAMTPHVPALLPFLTVLCKGMKPEILALVERSTHGTCKLESPKIFGMSFALPPLAEQSRIVTRVAALRRLCADLRQRLATSQSTQAQLAEALVENVA